MGKILIYWDRDGHTLNVWFDAPEKEYVCEETGDEVVLVKDREGKVIGFEKLNFRMTDTPASQMELPVEVKVA